jgi:hypothetical protein
MEDPTAFQAIRVVALSIAPDSVSAKISADTLNPAFGNPVHIMTNFALPDKTPAAGIPVHLQTQIAGGSWVTVQDGVTATDGSFAATLQLGQSTNVRAFTDGSWQRSEGDTPTLAISVSRLLTWSVAASMKVGIPYPITVQLLPAVAGVSVTLSNGSTALTDSDGKAIFSVTNPSTGFVRYQVKVAADQSFAAVVSNLANVWVR